MAWPGSMTLIWQRRRIWTRRYRLCPCRVITKSWAARILELMGADALGAFLVGRRHHSNVPPTVHVFHNGSFAMHIMNETSALARRPGYNVYVVGDKQISSWRKILDNNRPDGGKEL